MTLIERLEPLYARSPLPLQNLMVSAQGWLLAHRRWDPSLARRLHAQLLDSQWWSEEEFLEFQNNAVRDLVKLAAARVPYYQELFRREGIDPQRITTREDLHQIPILEKDAVRREAWSFLVGGRPQRGWRRSRTSGTTFTPLSVYSSRESFTRHHTFHCRLRSWAEVDDPLFPRRAHFTNQKIVPLLRSTGNVFWRHDRPGNTLLCSARSATAENAPYYAEALRRFEPEVVEGVTSAIWIVARVALRLGLLLPQTNAVITTSETLYPEWRNEIERAFGCKVYDQYSSRDPSSFWCECEHGVMHMNPEYGISEIVDRDGRPVAPGEEGEVIATAFTNREQLLIRYRIGDLAVAGSKEQCACGRHMPRVERLTGRVYDVLFIPEAGFIRGLGIGLLDGVVEAQIIQESLDELRVLVVPDLNYDDEAERELLHNARMRVGDAVKITVEKVSVIPRGPGGKYRSMVSKCLDSYPDILRW